MIACLLDRFITTMADEKEQIRRLAEEEESREKAVRPGTREKPARVSIIVCEICCSAVNQMFK